MTYINQDKLWIPKDESDDNIWADYIELLCFLKSDSMVTLDFISDRVKDNADDEKAEEDMIEAMQPFNEENGSEDGVNDIFIDADEFDRNIKKKSYLDDRLRRKIEDKYEFTKLREFTFLENYPFEIFDGYLKLKQVESLTNKQKIYIILLVSSILNTVTKSGLFKITHLFEDLCGPIFEKLLPINGVAKFIGAGKKSDEDLNHLFYSKVVEIQKLLGLHLAGDFTPEYAGKHNVGDGGLDWWGYYPFPDGLSASPVFFAQCACGRNWIDKQYDAHPSKWKNYLQFKNQPVTVHFIPRSFREFNNEWKNPLAIGEVVLIDRLRLLDLMTEENAQSIFNFYSELWTEITENKIDFFN